MLPSDLKLEQFNNYSPLAKRLAGQYLRTLQRLPLSFLPSLLREIAEYEFRFPAERRALEKELANLSSLAAPQLEVWFHGFRQIQISTELEHSNWVIAPAQFVEQLSSYLWTTHQLDAFRVAATGYGERLRSAVPPEVPSIPRLGITIIGRGVTTYEGALFRKLRAQGTYFSTIKPENGLQLLLDAAAARAKAHPTPYGHWYIDGAQEGNHDPLLSTVSYAALDSARAALLHKMQTEINRPGMGPEALRRFLVQMTAVDIGLRTHDPLMDHFRLKLLTEGSGTQIFSTTFVQWAAREALRRAQPLTLVARFAPRQRQKPMNELLSGNQEDPENDVVGSIIDADMAAYYNWLNQQRLPGAEQSSFVVWFEDHSYAMAIGPAVPRGTESSSVTDMRELLSWIA